MANQLTEDEWRRIYEFARASAYERGPDILLPEEAEDPDSRE